MKILFYLGLNIDIAGIFNYCMPDINETRCSINTLDIGDTYEYAMMFAVKEINKNPEFLYNHTLRYVPYSVEQKISVYSALSKQSVISIGPYSSELAEFWSNFLWVGRKSTISYGASSTKFSKRKDYPSIFSTVPSDLYQSKLLLQLAKRFNWQIVAVLQTQDEDGASMTLNLEEVVGKSICIKHIERINQDSKQQDYEKAIASLLEHKNIKTVFVFFTYESCQYFFIAAEKYKNELKKFQFVFSTSCGTMLHIPKSVQPYFEGMLTIQITNPMPDDFQKYLKSYYKNYTYNKYTPVRPVIKSVYAAAYAIRKWLGECQINPQDKDLTCAFLKPTTDSKKFTDVYLNDYLYNITENEQTEKRMFNDLGSVEDSYDIYQYNKGEFIPVGFWSYIEFSINKTALQINQSIELEESICSSSCRENQIQIQTTECCWTCSPCNPEEIIQNNVCAKCAIGTKTNEKQKECYPLPQVSMSMTDTMAYVVISISSTTILLSIILMGVYIKNRNKLIIREGNSQLCSLVGVILMSITPILYVQEPSPIACHAQKLMFGMPLTLCYAPLVLKTNRIYRIFLSSEKPKLRGLILISMTSQVLLTVGMVGIQLTMAVFWVLNTSQPVVVTEFKANYVEHHCNSSSRNMALNAIFPFVLMLSCAYWAFKTRNLPETYSEIKSIGITMYVTVFLAAAGLAVAYILGSHTKKQLYTLCFTFQGIAVVTLYGLYAMKIITMYYRKVTKRDKNKNKSKELDTIMNQLALYTMNPTLTMMSGIYERKESNHSATLSNSTTVTNNLSPILTVKIENNGTT